LTRTCASLCVLFVLFSLSFESNSESAALHGEQGSGHDISPILSLLPCTVSRVADAAVEGGPDVSPSVPLAFPLTSLPKALL
jgi:hypothetical protein